MRAPEEWREFLETLDEWAKELRAETAEYELDCIHQTAEGGDKDVDRLIIALSELKAAALHAEHQISPLLKKTEP